MKSIRRGRFSSALPNWSNPSCVITIGGLNFYPNSGKNKFLLFFLSNPNNVLFAVQNAKVTFVYKNDGWDSIVCINLTQLGLFYLMISSIFKSMHYLSSLLRLFLPQKRII